MLIRNIQFRNKCFVPSLTPTPHFQKLLPSVDSLKQAEHLFYKPWGKSKKLLVSFQQIQMAGAQRESTNRMPRFSFILASMPRLTNCSQEKQIRHKWNPFCKNLPEQASWQDSSWEVRKERLRRRRDTALSIPMGLQSLLWFITWLFQDEVVAKRDKELVRGKKQPWPNVIAYSHVS